MLIRSQDKRMIVNFDNICTVSAFPEKDSEDIYVEDGTGSLMVGRYSTREKAMKVLDMIQKAYADEKLVDYTKYLQMKEIEKMDDSTILALRNELMKKAVFQMPEEGSV